MRKRVLARSSWTLAGLDQHHGMGRSSLSIGLLCLTVILLVSRCAVLRRAIISNYAIASLAHLISTLAASPTPQIQAGQWGFQQLSIPNRMLGILAQRKGYSDVAMIYYQRARLETSDPIATYLLGQALLERGDRDSAVKIWRQLGAKAVSRLAWNCSIRAARALSREEWSTVIDLGSLAVTLDPSLAQAHYYLGVANMQLNHLDEAIIAYEKALELQVDSADRSRTLKGLGDTYRKLGDNNQALGFYREAVDELNTSISALEALGNLCRAEGFYSESEAAFKAILTTDSGYVYAYLGIGDIFRDQGMYSQARYWYEQARHVSPASGLGELSLGRLALLEDNPMLALDYLLLAEPLLPLDHKYIWAEIGRSYRAMGQLRNAAVAYSRAVAVVGRDKTCIWIWEEWAQTLTAQGDFLAAQKVWKEILSMDPMNQMAIRALQK